MAQTTPREITGPTYHERVAGAMKATHAAGSLNSYQTILDALHRKFPTEEALRIYVEALEREVTAKLRLSIRYRLLEEDE